MPVAGRATPAAAVALLLAAALLLLPAGGAAPSTPEVLSCAALTARLAADGRPRPSALVVEGVAVRIDSDGDHHQIALCGRPDASVLCITAAAEERQIGDRLVLAGTVAEAGRDWVRLEPCTHRMP